MNLVLENFFLLLQDDELHSQLKPSEYFSSLPLSPNSETDYATNKTQYPEYSRHRNPTLRQSVDKSYPATITETPTPAHHLVFRALVADATKRVHVVHSFFEQ